MEYEALLKRAREKLPESVIKVERFEIPQIKGHIEGNKTIVTNLFQIVDSFHREPQQLIKYLQRELASPAAVDGQRVIFGRKLSSAMINEKVEAYAEIFVICKVCKKPDTLLKREDRILTLRCSACGSKYSIKTKIS